MNRRQFLGAVGGLGGLGGSLAGCLGEGAVPSQSTESPTPSSTVDAEVEVPSCPEKPDPLTRDAVLGFAMQFEKAYVTRKTNRGRDDIVSIDVRIDDALTDRDATRTNGGWVVRFSVIGPATRYRPDPNSTETAHSDPPLYAANYFITDQRVLRAQATEAVDPREHGTVVQCPPE